VHVAHPPAVLNSTAGEPGGSPTNEPAHTHRPETKSSLLPRLRPLSLGAGVQSTTVLLMTLHGDFPERLDRTIFADTGWEPRAVYAHLGRLEAKARAGGISIHRVGAGNLKQVLLDAVHGKKKRVANPPFYVRNRDEAGEYATPDRSGMLWHSRTKEYKIDPIRRQIRRLDEAAIGSGRPPAGCVGCVEQWFGISFNEWRRMRRSDVAYIVNRYPLVDRRRTRARSGCDVRRPGCHGHHPGGGAVQEAGVVAGPTRKSAAARGIESGRVRRPTDTRVAAADGRSGFRVGGFLPWNPEHLVPARGPSYAPARR
jgi:hypothetical protein